MQKKRKTEKQQREEFKSSKVGLSQNGCLTRFPPRMLHSFSYKLLIKLLLLNFLHIDITIIFFYCILFYALLFILFYDICRFLYTGILQVL